MKMVFRFRYTLTNVIKEDKAIKKKKIFIVTEKEKI